MLLCELRVCLEKLSLPHSQSPFGVSTLNVEPTTHPCTPLQDALLGREGQEQQDKDEQMKEMVSKGFASRNAARKPNRTYHGTCPLSPVWDIPGAAPNMPLPAGSKVVVPRHLVEMQSRSTAQVWISAVFPRPCLDTAKRLIWFVAP